MMAEEQQDDLSMEDILSSIKDILDKDSQSASPEKTDPAIETPVDEVSAEPEDEVFNLSKAMIIDDSLLEDNEEIDLNLEDIDVISASEVSKEPETVTPTVEAEPIVETVVESEPVVETVVEPEPVVEVEAKIEPIIEPEPLTPVVDEVDPIDNINVENEIVIEAEPIFSPEDDVSGGANELQLPDDSVDVEDLLAAPIKEVEADMVATETADVAEVAENIDDILSSASKVIYADSKTEENHTVTETPRDQADKTETDAVDISANIISNFAKMFAEKSPAETHDVVEKTKVPQDLTPIKEMGNGSKTISEVVEDVIKDIISVSVSAEINSNVDIAAYAKEEIKAQTKTWLDAKLSEIVENTVQKEIERVMAKVGK